MITTVLNHWFYFHQQLITLHRKINWCIVLDFLCHLSQDTSCHTRRYTQQLQQDVKELSSILTYPGNISKEQPRQSPQKNRSTFPLWSITFDTIIYITYNWVFISSKIYTWSISIYTSIIGSKPDSALYSLYTHSVLKQTGVRHKQDPGFQYRLHFLSATLCYLLWRPGSNYRLVWCCQSVL